jgi:hypothetical protein
MLPVHRKEGNQLSFFYAGKYLDFPTESQEQEDFDMTFSQAYFP